MKIIICIISIFFVFSCVSTNIDKENTLLVNEKEYKDNNRIALDHRIEGHKFYARGDYTTAIICFTNALKINPNDLVSYFIRGDSYKQLGQFQKAIDDFNSYIELSNNITNDDQKQILLVWIMRGGVYYSIKKYDEAINNFTHVILYGIRESDKAMISENSDNKKELDELIAMAYTERGRVYSINENYVNALSDFSNSLKLNPNSAFTFYCRGLVYGSMEDLDNAKNDLYEAHKLDPNNQTYLEMYNLTLEYLNEK